MAVKHLLIGLDGADHRLIDSMIADGELPHFRALRERSAAIEVENDPGMGNVQFWTSAAVGAGPDHHAHYFYMQFDPATYDIQLDYNLDLPKLTPFWKQLDTEGYRVAVVDWYEMPVTPLKNGAVMHRWMAHEPLTVSIFHPPELAALAGRYASRDPIAEGFASTPRESAPELLEFHERTLSRIEIKKNFFCDHFRNENWDLYIACLSEPHNIGHYYIHHEDEKHGRHDPAIARALGQPLRECYRRLDTAIGAMIEAAGPEATVRVFGGPGMGRFISANSALDEIARRVDCGYEAALSGAETAKKTYNTLLPQSLRQFLRPLARAIRRRTMDRAYMHRRFFAIPHNDNAGAIRINLKGREKYGTINRGPEYEALVAKITAGVSSFKNPDTGRSIAGRVIDIEKTYNGPNRDLLPDLFIEWDRKDTFADFSRLISEKFGEITLPQHERTGDHGPHGFYWSPDSLGADAMDRPEGLAARVLSAVRAAPPQN